MLGIKNQVSKNIVHGFMMYYRKCIVMYLLTSVSQYIYTYIYIYIFIYIKVFQRREDGSQPFNNSWNMYASSFGNINNEFLLGKYSFNLYKKHVLNCFSIILFPVLKCLF